MASSSKRRRASSSKQSSAGKARVISAKRADALPRKSNISTGRRKPVVQPPIDAPIEPPATAVATKTTRAAGRASGKLKRPAATKVRRAGAAAEPGTAEAATPAPVAEKRETPEVEALAFLETEVEMTEVEMEVEASAIVEETTIVDAPFALAVEAVTFPNKEIGRLPACEETRAPPLAHTTVASPVPVAPAPQHGKRALVTVVSQLLSTLRRWTGIRF